MGANGIYVGNEGNTTEKKCPFLALFLLCNQKTDTQ